MIDSYQSFLESKAVCAIDRGDSIARSSLNPALFEFQKDLALWMMLGGSRAGFASFGMGKTLIQIQIVVSILEKHGGAGLIVCPLGVKGEFVRDAQRFFQIEPKYIRTNAEYQELTDAGERFFLTNYERIRDGDIDPNQFRVVSLDEASVLRSYGSKTYQTFLTLFEKVPFKFVCTATPSPNRFKELIHYAGFLGVMDTGQALTRFFKRDSSSAGNLTIHPHKEREFWLWVSTWATFLTRPSDLGYSDLGYDLPPLKIIRHRLPVDHATAGIDSWGQGKMFRNAAVGVSDAAREKRDSLQDRLAKVVEIIDAGEPDQHWIVWHDLEDERRALEKDFKPEAETREFRSVYGTQKIDLREQDIADFSDGKYRILATKPVVAGSGCNFQRFCHSAIYMGLGFKFNDWIQSVHRLQRFLQPHEVVIHLIYTESEDAVHDALMLKWQQHEKLVENMKSIIKQYGLNSAKRGDEMRRSIGITRQEIKGDLYRAVNNDNIEEMRGVPDNSVDLVVTSWPFSNHYEYTASYNDFGHNTDDGRFFDQMAFLTPQIVRALAPGRMYCVHCKDRLLYGSVTGLGMYSVNPFSDKCVAHLQKHGLIYCGRITIVTDVVRENNQTYRLGFSENAKDGTKMGVGSPEYILLFRKLPTDRARAYADKPVAKKKPDVLCSEHVYDVGTGGEVGTVCIRCNAHTTEPHAIPFEVGLPIIPGTGYSRSKWQFDASPFWRSNGNRFLSPQQVQEMPMDQIRELWHQWNAGNVYDYKQHVAAAEMLEAKGLLPASFMALDPLSHSPWVWDDVVRMRTLNTEQARNRVEGHICPLQFDVVERLIERYSMPGELVLDPFAGLMTVPYVAIQQRRRGFGIELNSEYWHDGTGYCRAAEMKITMPTLFDSLEEPADGRTEHHEAGV